MGKTLICSIIIPIYNVSSYIGKCLDSISDILGDERFEILLVNDGSTDGSECIAHEYERQFSNVIVINKENGGLSDARNAGLEVSQGKYIVFIDSDDWMESGAVVRLLEIIEETGCDVVQCDMYYAYVDYLLYERKDGQPAFYSGKDAMYELIRNQHIKNFAWGKIYRRSVIGECRFKKGMYFEDSFWQHLIIGKSKQVCCLNMPLYYYRQRGDGISGEFSIRNFDLVSGYFDRLSYIESNYPQYVSVMRDIIAGLLWDYRAKCLKDNELKALWNQFIRHYHNRCGKRNWRYIVMNLPYICQSCLSKVYALYSWFLPSSYTKKYLNNL